MGRREKFRPRRHCSARGGAAAYPLVFSGAFYRDIGVTFLLAAISASAWNIVGGYAGQVSVGHSMFFGLGAYAAACLHAWGWPPMAGIPFGIALSVGACGVDRHADLPADRPLFQHGDHRGRRTDPNFLWHLGFGRRCDRPAGSGVGARLVGPDVSQRIALLLLFLGVLAIVAVRHLT